MKTRMLLLLSFALLLPLSGHGQSVIIPLKVTKAFNLKYPAAHNALWSNEGKDFKVIFKEEGFNYETTFNSNGYWLVTQRAIPFGQLPAIVKNNLYEGEFSKWKVNAAFVLFLPGMITKYRLDIAKDNITKAILMSWDGKLLDDHFKP